ncbi:hypothetical protein [Undibacterium sp.]|uniref:hypothetical protein n=1 Tax=Undibacterium sp. TaxID=1914977 RepID=UPI00374D311A
MTNHFLNITKLTKLAKRVAALVLLLSFFLPLSQCSSRIADQEIAAQPASQAVQEAAQTATQAAVSAPAEPPTDIAAYSAYPWPSAASIVVLLLFAWPAALQLYALLKPDAFAANGYKWALLELPLIAVTLCCILLLSSLGQQLRYGAVVASAAAYCYLLAVLVPAALRGGPRGAAA